jgi:hypothetical protein
MATDNTFSNLRTWAGQRRGAIGVPGNPLGALLSKNERAAVVGHALGYVMGLRKGDSCSDKDLAYADHYLQARVMVAYLGPSGYTGVRATVLGYEGLKKVFEALGILPLLSSDGQCPQPVSPDMASVRWGMLGAEHGQADFGIEMKDQVRKALKRIWPPSPK